MAVSKAAESVLLEVVFECGGVWGLVGGGGGGGGDCGGCGVVAAGAGVGEV